MESISSMKIIDGAASRAITNNSRTILDPYIKDRQGSVMLGVIPPLSIGKHSSYLSNIFLHEFSTRDTNKSTICMMSYSTS